jgi:hypothetical protein
VSAFARWVASIFFFSNRDPFEIICNNWFNVLAGAREFKLKIFKSKNNLTKGNAEFRQRMLIFDSKGAAELGMDNF